MDGVSGPSAGLEEDVLVGVGIWALVFEPPVLLLPPSGDGDGLSRTRLALGNELMESSPSFFTLHLPVRDPLSSDLLVNQVCLKDP